MVVGIGEGHQNTKAHQTGNEFCFCFSSHISWPGIKSNLKPGTTGYREKEL